MKKKEYVCKKFNTIYFMNKLILIIIFFLILSCKQNKQSNNIEKGNSSVHDSVTISFTKDKENINDEDTLYVSQNNNAFVLGDKYKNIINYLAIKFEPYIRYTDFPIDIIYKGEKHAIDFSSNPKYKYYKTVISEGYKKGGVNFAGHYCFIYWGCGTECKQSILVDLKTGKIYNGIMGSLGFKHYNNSRMLIVNPTLSIGSDPYHPKPEYYLDCPYCKPKVYIWNENKKEFEKR